MKVDDGNLSAGGRRSLGPKPEPRRRMSSGAKIAVVAGVLAAVMIGAGVTGSLMFSRLRDLGTGCPPAPIAEVPPMVTESKAVPGERLVTLDWTLPPDTRPQCYSPVDVIVNVALPNAEKAAGADVVALWGTDLVERTRTDQTGTAKILAWPARVGVLHVYARVEGVGAAAIPCVIDQHMSHGSRGDKAGFRCQGAIAQDTLLALPAAPACADDKLKPVFDVIAPGACFGLTALELSRLPYPSTHVSTTRYEAFHPRPPRGGLSPTLQVPLEKGAVATDLTLKSTGADAERAFPLLLQALGGALGSPKTAAEPDAGCASGTDWATYTFEAEGVGAATLSGRLTDCDPATASELRLELRR
jgi:hypothetical protein